ncbi:receptor activity-modifying protein 2 [Ctenodactylus gundi]
MAWLRAERAPGGPQLPAIPAGRPAALRLLLLLLGGERSGPGRAGGAGGPAGRGWRRRPARCPPASWAALSCGRRLAPPPGGRRRAASHLGKTGVQARPVERLGKCGAVFCQQLPVPTGNMTAVSYETSVQDCWDMYKSYMDHLQNDWCNWTMISRPYSDLQICLEEEAETFKLGFPNPWAERIIFEAHLTYFANCSLMQPTFSDPPEDVLLAMIIAPICLIPFLVTLVVWRSKDSEAKA